MSESIRDKTKSASQSQVAVSSSQVPSSSTRLAENPLSEREMDVAELLVTGASNNEIAEDLVISPHTVKVHLRNIYEKLQVSSRTEASMLILQQGWIVLPGVETSAAPPDPDLAELEPLTDLPGPLFVWQRFYLLAAVGVTLLLVMLPTFVGQPLAPPTDDLLSDGSITTATQPTVDLAPRWESKTPLPSARSRFELVLAEGWLYAIGGEGTQADVTDRMDVYDLSVNEWTPSTTLPLPLSNVAAAYAEGQIYVAGGTTPSEDARSLTVVDRLFAYRPNQERWRILGALPVPLAGPSLVADTEALYLLGGWDGVTMRDEIWRLPLPAPEPVEADEWQLLARMDAAHAFGGAALVNGDIYVAGGYDGQRELSNAQRYDMATGTWERLPPLSTPRGGMKLLHDGLALFAVGGGWTQPANTLERFDPATSLWSHFPSPIQGEWRSLGAVASPSGYLYLAGGWSDSRLSVHLQYQSSFRTFLPSTTNSRSNNP